MKKIAEVLNAKGVMAVVSEYLEQYADEQDRRQGMSIADFLLRKVLLDQETRHLRHLSPFEQLEIMKAENPLVQELIDTFDLELVNTVSHLSKPSVREQKELAPNQGLKVRNIIRTFCPMVKKDPI